MAQYNVTHACGCEATVRLTGKQAARYATIERLAKTTCSACRAEQAAASAAASNLPALTGSDKQVAWASDLRPEWLGKVAEVADSLRARLTNPAMADALEAAVAEVVEQGVARTAAAAWIDSRGQSVEALIKASLGKLLGK